MGEQSGASIEAAQLAETKLVKRNLAAVDTDGDFQQLLQSAHEKAQQYKRRLDSIEVEVNEAAGRVNLNSPASARQFQAFLVEKQREILAVLADAQQSSTGLTSQMGVLGTRYQLPEGAEAGPNAGPAVPPQLTGPGAKPRPVYPLDPDGAMPGPDAHGYAPVGLSEGAEAGPNAGPAVPPQLTGPGAKPRPVYPLDPDGAMPGPDAHGYAPVGLSSGGGTGDGAGSDSIVRPASFHAPLRQDSGTTDTTADNSINPGSSWAPTAPTTPRYHQDPSVPNTAADDSINPGGMPHSTGTGQRPITLDPNAYGPHDYVEQVPHSGQWVPPDQADPNVFTVKQGALAPYNSEQIGTAPNGDTVWRRTNPGPR